MPAPHNFLGVVGAVFRERREGTSWRATESIQNARSRFAAADRLDRRSHCHSAEFRSAIDFGLFQQNRPISDRRTLSCQITFSISPAAPPGIGDLGAELKDRARHVPPLRQGRLPAARMPDTSQCSLSPCVTCVVAPNATSTRLHRTLRRTHPVRRRASASAWR